MPRGVSVNRGIMNWSAMLRDEDVIEIRRLRALPKGQRPTLRELAEKYHVSQACICQAAMGTSWKHLKTNRGGGHNPNRESDTALRPGESGGKDDG